MPEIHVSETVEASAAFHLTPDDAIRTSALYEFLRGDSLRQEGGTVYLQQSHADGDAGLVYWWRGGAELELGYHFTYFFQHEKSHEDDNVFELIDNAVRARLSVRF